MPAGRTEEDPIPGRRIVRELLGGPIARRAWLRRAAGTALGLGSIAWGGAASARGKAEEDPKAPRGDDPAEELGRAEAKARQVTSRPLLTFQSAHYQAIGDAAQAFIKLTLSDCEEVAVDYVNHFRARGFDVKAPGRRLTVIAFEDERPFLKFAENAPPGMAGFYSRRENWLVLFDFRKAPMLTDASGQTNRETVTHEAMHQLTFNTGLLERRDDIPLCIVEGLGMYCEHRRRSGRSEPGQVNPRRLKALAMIQRRMKWISLPELLTNDAGWFTRGEDRRELCYAQSWVLVYHLMTDRVRLPQFRDYLRAIRSRRGQKHRLDDARAQFGDLDQLDRELRRMAIRLEQTLG
jgi:hypothetical protein